MSNGDIIGLGESEEQAKENIRKGFEIEFRPSFYYDENKVKLEADLNSPPYLVTDTVIFIYGNG